MKVDNQSISLELNHSVYTEIKGKPKRIYLLLHGYLLDGKYMIDEFRDSLGDNCMIIAPNGPFLVPVKKMEKYKAKYAWYFFDPGTKSYYVNYDPGAKYLGDLLEIYNTDNLPVSVIGYSQGGYLAPRVANYSSSVDQIISIASVFRPKLFEINKSVEYRQINSKGDLVVEFENAKSAASEMVELGANYRLKILERSGHRIDDEYKKTLQEFLKN